MHLRPSPSRGLAALAVAALLACGDDLGPRVPAAIEVTPAEARVAVGATLQLEAAVVDAAGSPIGDGPVSFESSDPDTVTVDERGLLTAGETPGRATVTAASGELTAEVAVEVVLPASAIVVRPSSLALDTDEIAGLSVTVTDENGQPIEEPAVAFESSNPDVIDVVEEPGSHHLRAGRGGTATVTVTSGTLRTDVPVTVSQIPTKLAITPTSVVLVPGESHQLAAAIVDKTGDEIEGDETISWTTSDPAVLTVDQFGIIKSVGPEGAAFVTATGGDFTGSIGVFVGTAPAGEILSRAAPHDWVYGVGVAPNGRYLVSASGELLGGTIPDFSVPLRIQVGGNPGDIAFNGSVSRAFVSGAGGGAAVVDLTTNAVTDFIPLRMGNGQSVGVSGDGSVLIGGGSDGFELVDIASKTSLGGAAIGNVSKITRHPLKPLFYLSAGFSAVYEVDARSGEILRRFPRSAAESHVVTPDGTRLYIVGPGDSIGVWNLDTGEQERTLPGAGGGDVDITPDGKFLYVIGGSRLQIVERTAGAVVRTVTLGGAAWKIAMSHDGIAVISNFDFNSGWVDFVR